MNEWNRRNRENRGMNGENAGESERVRAGAVYAAASHPDDLRALCAGDLFFLLVNGMVRTDMDNYFCFSRCR